MRERLCPLCDQDWDATTCPIHGVPTIGPASGAAVRLEVGTILVEQYRIDGLLGQGGMGALLSATDLRDHAKVVVKVLRGERVTEIGNVRRFYQEARAARALSHPNIVEILQFGVDEATRAPFLAMEFVPGRTLKALVAEDGPLTEQQAATIFLPIARALGAAHRAQVLHRDLKPSNIMVDEGADGPNVKVLDFGLAKILEDPNTAPLTQPGKTVGTPAFMSPEQVTQRPQDFRTDLYGLGCVLHSALTGQPPFVGHDLIEVMRKQIRQPAPPLPAVLVDGQAPSEGLRVLHAALLAKPPEERPRSTEAVVRAFIDLQGQATGPTGTSFSLFEQARTRVDRTPGPLKEVDAAMFTSPDAPYLEEEEEEEDPTLAHPVTTVMRGQDGELSADGEGLGSATERGALADSESDPHIDDVPTPLYRPAFIDALDPAAPPGSEGPDLQAESQHQVSDDDDALLTSVMPASYDDKEDPDGRTPLTPAGPELQERGEVRVVAAPLQRPSFTVPVSPAVPRPKALPPGWPLVAVVGLGLVVVSVVVVLTAAETPVSTRTPAVRPTVRPEVSQGVIATPRVVPSNDEGRIEIRSSPTGAEVLLNGRRAGRTPISVDRPPESGRTNLLLIQAGHRAQSLVLRHDTASPVKVTLRRR